MNGSRFFSLSFHLFSLCSFDCVPMLSFSHEHYDIDCIKWKTICLTSYIRLFSSVLFFLVRFHSFNGSIHPFIFYFVCVKIYSESIHFSWSQHMRTIFHVTKCSVSKKSMNTSFGLQHLYHIYIFFCSTRTLV